MEQKGTSKMKVGDMIRLHVSTRRNGSLAGKVGLIVDFDNHANPVVSVAGELRSFHLTQVEKVINESR